MASDPRDGALAGAADLIKKLQALGALDNGKISLGAVRAGMNVSLDAARVKIPVGSRAHRTYKGKPVQPGFGRASLRVVTTSKTDSGLPAALLSVRKEAYYETQFLERGAPRHRGPIRAQPWLVPAFYNSRAGMETAIVAYLQKRLAKIAKDGRP